MGEDEIGSQMGAVCWNLPGRKCPPAKPTIELNPSHPLVVKLDKKPMKIVLQIWPRCYRTKRVWPEGGHLVDPAAYVNRLNKLLLELVK